MQKMRLALEWFLNPDHLPLLIGLEHGWFADVGIDLELVEPAAHLDAVQALLTGDVDVAITEPIHLAQDVAKGLPVVGFARFLHTNGGVMYLAGHGIERPRDMVGARVQYPGAPGPGGLAIVDSMIQADGGAPSAHTLQPVDHGFEHTDALLSGKADVATLAFYNFEVVQARHRGVDARFFALKDWGVPDFCQLIFVASRERAQSHANLWRRLLQVVSRGMDFIHQHPEQARWIYLRRTAGDPDDGMGRAIFDATVPCFTFDLSMSPSYYEALGRWLAQTGQVDATPDLSACWDDRVVWG